MAQRDRLSWLPAHGQAQPSNQVLAEVDDGMAGRRRCDGDRRNELSAADGRPRRRDQGTEIAVEQPHRRPITVVKPAL